MFDNQRKMNKTLGIKSRVADCVKSYVLQTDNDLKILLTRNVYNHKVYP